MHVASIEENMDESTELVAVDCDSHHDILIGGLWSYFQSSHEVDFDVQWCGRPIRAHRIVLDVFLPRSKLLPRFDNEGPDTNRVSRHLDYLLEFLYKGRVTVDRDSLEGLQQLATDLDFRLLVDAVESAKNAGAVPVDLVRRPRKGKQVRQSGADVSDSSGPARRTRSGKTKSVRQSKKSDKVPTGTDPPLSGKHSAQLSCNPAASDKTPTPADNDSTRSSGDPASFSTDPASSSIDPASSSIDPASSSIDPASSSTDPASSSLDPPPTVKVQSSSKKETVSDDVDNPNFDLNSTHRKRPGRQTKKPSKIEKLNSSSLSRREYQRAWVKGRPLLECSLCDYQTRCKKSLQIHSSRHDPTVSIFRCTDCSRAFLVEAKLERHRALSHSDLVPGISFSCLLCDFRSGQKRKVRHHMAFCHELTLDGKPFPAPFRCGHCELKFHYASQLAIHEATHKSERSFQCELCGYAAKRSYELGLHQRTVHEKMKKFMCHICGHKSSNSSHHNVHMRTHTDQRPYACSIVGCFKAFTTTHKLKCHIERHSSQRNHSCNLCSFACFRRDGLIMHLRRKHQIDSIPNASSSKT